jgi:hypothetical protein
MGCTAGTVHSKGPASSLHCFLERAGDGGLAPLALVEGRIEVIGQVRGDLVKRHALGFQVINNRDHLSGEGCGLGCIRIVGLERALRWLPGLCVGWLRVARPWLSGRRVRSWYVSR